MRTAIAAALLGACGGGGRDATAPPGAPPATALVVTQQPLVATSGSPLTTQPVVQLVGALGAPATVSAAMVTAQLVTPSGAMLLGTTSMMTVGGVARFTDLAIRGAGTFFLAFSAPGLTGTTSQAVVVSPLLGPPASLALAPGRVVLAAAATTTITAAVRDADGNPLTMPVVAFTSRAPSVATVDSRGVVSGVGGGQTIVGASVIGTAITDSMFAVVVPAAGTALVSSLTALSLPRDTTVTVSVFVDLRSSPRRLASGLIDVVFQPSQLTFVAAAAGANFAPSVSAADTATGRLHLAFADAAGASGVAELARLTFRASPAAGRVGTFALVASEMTASDFTDLLPGMVQVAQPLVLR